MTQTDRPLRSVRGVAPTFTTRPTDSAGYAARGVTQ